ncbi:hypothetical protein OSTOST_09980 [Ostertagia ostertagi]
MGEFRTQGATAPHTRMLSELEHAGISESLSTDAEKKHETDIVAVMCIVILGVVLAILLIVGIVLIVSSVLKERKRRSSRRKLAKSKKRPKKGS